MRSAGIAAGRPCLLELSRPWLTAPLEDHGAALRLHAAGALLRVAGREREGDDATTRATVVLAQPPADGMGLRRFRELVDRLGTATGLASPSSVWEARLSEIRLYRDTRHFAPRLAYYASALGDQPRGLREAEQLARLAFEANRPDLADKFLAVLPAQSIHGSRALIAGGLLADSGRYREALEQFARADASDREHLSIVLWMRRPLVEMIDAAWMERIFPDPADRAAAYADQALFWRILNETDRARVSMAQALRLAEAALPAQQKLPRLVLEAAALGRSADADRLIERAPTDDRPELWAEAAYGAAGAGDWAAVDRAVKRGAAPIDSFRLSMTALVASKAPSAARAEAVRRIQAAIDANRGPKRAFAFEEMLRAAATEAEFHSMRRIVLAEPDADMRADGFIQLSFAMRNARLPGPALEAARSARADLRPGSAKTGDVAWLLRTLGDEDGALAVARSIADPALRAAALVQIAHDPLPLEPERG